MKLIQSRFHPQGQYFTFDDVLIQPRFSELQTRKAVSLESNLGSLELNLPILSANMDTITESEMCLALAKRGARGVLHRFCSIEKNIELLHAGTHKLDDREKIIPIGSFGLGDAELERAQALFQAGSKTLCLDVAHGAQRAVVDQIKSLVKMTKAKVELIVGNFASGESVTDFLKHLGVARKNVTALKVGIGGGSACTTRMKSGNGVPQLSALLECIEAAKGIAIISDGGHRFPSDIAKALAAGAKAVMLGGMLSGTDETPGQILTSAEGVISKRYRGSASKESYEVQGKNADWRAAEGEAFNVPYKGSVNLILQDIEGGIRSSLTYVGAKTLIEYQKRARFLWVSPSTQHENGAHGKK